MSWRALVESRSSVRKHFESFESFVIHDIQDRDGGILLLATLFGMYPFLKKLFADGGYQGPDFQKALAKILPQLETEIVKRSDRTKGFVVLPRRWVSMKFAVLVLFALTVTVVAEPMPMPKTLT
jgi:hypothetical protein